MNLSSLCIDHKASLVLPDWWLLQLTSRSRDAQRQSQDLSIYGYLVGAAVLLSTIREATFLNVLINSSMSLHNLMLSAVVKAPVLFFDTNPVGRVLNRFSRDINIMEELLPEAFLRAMQVILFCIGAITLQSVLIPWIILPAFPLMVIFALIGRYYLNPSRDLRRIEGVTRSPVLSHFSNSLEGLVSIRTYNKENSSIGALYRFVIIRDLNSFSRKGLRDFSIKLSGACAWTSIILAGKRDNWRHSCRTVGEAPLEVLSFYFSVVSSFLIMGEKKMKSNLVLIVALVLESGL